MDIQISDTFLQVRNRDDVTLSNKVLAKIYATGEIWIDPDITFEECQLALKLVLEGWARLTQKQIKNEETGV